MKNSSAVARLPRHDLWRMALAALLCLALAAAVGCGGDATATPEPTATATPEPHSGAGGDSDESGHADNGDSSDSDADKVGHEGGDKDSDKDKVESPANGDSGGASSGQSSASSSEDSTDNGSEDSDGGDSAGSGSGGTASNQNPNGEGVPFDNSRNVVLFGAEPLNIVQWTVGPTVGGGELVAEGVLTQDAVIFNPTVDGEGSGFSVFYKGHEEAMVELLPDLGPMFVWDTFQTVAETEMEIEGLNFSIRAYSPLFMDVGPGDLELRVYGYLPSGEDALLSVQDINAE